MPLTESRSQQRLSFDDEPETVAEVCQRILAELGRVDSVSRETGVIAGRIKVNWATNWVFVTLTISRNDRGTQLAVETQRKEGLLTEGGAQKGLAMFVEHLGKLLRTGSNSGW